MSTTMLGVDAIIEDVDADAVRCADGARETQLLDRPGDSSLGDSFLPVPTVSQRKADEWERTHVGSSPVTTLAEDESSSRRRR
jgi:hypothetical protein